MENFKRIQPEVIVGFGEKTTFEEPKPPFKTIVNLHIELEDWFGDDLVVCYPAFIVTEKLKKELENSKFSGFKFLEIEISEAKYFENNYQLDKPLPKFFWFKIDGQEYIDDIIINQKKELFVKPKLLKFFKQKFNINYMQIDHKGMNLMIYWTICYQITN